MLCFRCEHRAAFLQAELEGIHPPRPRNECGEPLTSKVSCYMFIPCLPIITAPECKGDKRPRFGPSFIASREQAVRLMSREELECYAIFTDRDEVALGWRTKP